MRSRARSRTLEETGPNLQSAAGRFALDLFFLYDCKRRAERRATRPATLPEKEVIAWRRNIYSFPVFARKKKKKRKRLTPRRKLLHRDLLIRSLTTRCEYHLTIFRYLRVINELCFCKRKQTNNDTMRISFTQDTSSLRDFNVD